MQLKYSVLQYVCWAETYATFTTTKGQVPKKHQHKPFINDTNTMLSVKYRTDNDIWTWSTVLLFNIFVDALTNLTEQISRRFPGDSRRDFKKNSGHVCIASACYVMWSCLPCRCSLPKYRTKTWYAFYTTRGCSKDKIGRPVTTQISDLVHSFMTGNQCGRSPYTKISRSSKFHEL